MRNMIEHTLLPGVGIMVAGAIGILFGARPLLAACLGLALAGVCCLDGTRRQRASEKPATSTNSEEATALLALQSSKEWFQGLLEAAPDAMIIANAEGRILLVNAQAEMVFGYTREEMYGRPVEMLLPERFQAGHIHHRARYAATSQTRPMGAGLDLYGCHKEGREFPVEISLSPLETEEGLFVIAAVRDITRRKEDAKALQESEERFRSAISAMREGLVLQDQEGIQVCNESAWHILGLTREQLLGHGWVDPGWKALHEDGSPWPWETYPVMVTLKEGMAQHDVAMGIQKPDGERIWISVNSVPLFHPGENRPYAAVVTFYDITERRWLEQQIQEQIARIHETNVQLGQRQDELGEANARLESLATTDGLTNIKNHRAFQEKIAAEYSRASRYQTPLSLLLLDVDYFKEFNDAFGHPAGDQVLIRVAALLQSTARTTDFVARYGGEEFAVVLSGTDSLGAMEAAERIRSAIAEAAWEHRAITVSIGVSSLDRAMENVGRMIEEADKALYASKDAGRNRVTHYTLEAQAILSCNP